MQLAILSLNEQNPSEIVHRLVYCSIIQFIQIDTKMGNNNSDLTESQFKQQWKISNTFNGRNIWENKQNPTLKYEEYIIKDDQIQNNAKLLNLRRNHPFIVNAISVKSEGFSCQMNHDAKRIFVQYNPQRLLNISSKFSYPDILHLYDIFIHGYSQLANAVGFFNVDIEQVGVNERGGAKVWVSGHFESNVITGTKVTQAKMVSEILSVLQSITDNSKSGQYPNIGNYFKQQEVRTFPQLNTLFRQYIVDYSGREIPTKLSTFNNSPNPQDQMLSNEYINLTKRVSQFKVVPEDTNIDTIQQKPYVVSGQPRAESIYVGTQQVDTKVAQPYPTVVYAQPQLAPKGEFIGLVSPIVSETFIGGPVNRPATSINLARTKSQDFNQFKVRATTLNPQIRFGQANNVASISPGVQQHNQPLFIQRSLNQQNAIQYPPQNVQQVPVQLFSSNQQQNAVLVNKSQQQNTFLVNKSSIYKPTYIQTARQTRNVPLEVSTTENILDQLKGVPITQSKGDFVTTTYPSIYGKNDNRLQQQRVISQAYEVTDGIKVADSEVQNVSAGTSYTKANGLKGSETIAWEDYTNRTDKGLSNFGRAVPQSFDIGVQKKSQSHFNTTKFSPESDGKSSAEFLALLSQIKSGIGQSSSSQNYSYSGSKKEGVQGSYYAGGNYQTTKYSSTNYVSSNYQGGLDPQLHADLQKYRQ